MIELAKDEACPHCGRFANRGLSIDAVIIKNKKVLLIKRGAEPDKGYWATPGGFVGWDESAEDAAAREVKEETGLTVKGSRLVGVYSDPGRHPKQVVNIVYLIEVDDALPVAGDDAEAVEWFDLDNLPEKMALDHRQNIQDALSLL